MGHITGWPCVNFRKVRFDSFRVVTPAVAVAQGDSLNIFGRSQFVNLQCPVGFLSLGVQRGNFKGKVDGSISSQPFAGRQIRFQRGIANAG